MHTLRIGTILIVCFLFTVGAKAQLTERLAPPPARQPVKNKTGAARTESILLTLPFWDDFSTVTNGVPDSNRWQNSNSVWVNFGSGIHPPTLNVATFDGLDSAGHIYDSANINGFRDKLISQPIDLSTVTPALQNTVYLSFFYQWKGNGEPPDKNDYLQVEFKNAGGSWVVIDQIKDNTFDQSVFYPYIVQVAGADYLHNNFQFRLRSFGRLSGAFDTWIVDYVYLNQRRTSTDLAFPDRAAAMPLGPLFGQYYAMPLAHFRNSKTIYEPSLEVKSLQDKPTALDYYTYGTFVNLDTATDVTTTYQTMLGMKQAIKGVSNTILPFEYVETTNLNIPDPDDPQQFMPDADSIAITLRVELDTRDNVPTTSMGDYDVLIYSPINFRVNDTLQSTYILEDYYAYDDGSAEYTIELTQAGNRAAYQFDMLTTEADTLVGFDIYVPDAYLQSSVTADFYVYGDNGGEPNSQPLFIPSRTLTKQGGTNFQRILFQPARLVKDRFYIGWKEPGTGLLKIGLDKNNNTGDRIFVNTNGTWVQTTDVTGSLMIRPLFGAGTVEVVTGIENEKRQVMVYPNPSSGIFYVKGQFTQLELINVNGKSLSMTAEDQGDGSTRVTINNANPGLYLLRWKTKQSSGVHKLLIKQ